MVQIDMKVLKSMRTKKIYARLGRTRHGDELTRFEGFVYFSVNQDFLDFFVLIIYPWKSVITQEPSKRLRAIKSTSL